MSLFAHPRLKNENRAERRTEKWDAKLGREFARKRNDMPLESFAFPTLVCKVGIKMELWLSYGPR